MGAVPVSAACRERTETFDGWRMETCHCHKPAGHSRGLMSEKDVEMIHEHMCRELLASGARIDGIFVCPHEEGTCTCRKPEIGLFQQAEKQFAVDKQKSYMIGDGETDIMAGKRFGVHTIAIGSEPANPEFRCSNLDEAADYILGIHKSNL